MNHVVVLVWLTMAATAFAQSAKSLEQDLMNVERAFTQASVKRDRGTLERIYADEFVGTRPDGVVRTKNEDLQDAMSNPSVRGATTSDMRVQLHGNVGVVTGLNTFEIARAVPGFEQNRNGVTSLPVRFTDVFVMRDGRWQIVASHGTIVRRDLKIPRFEEAGRPR